MSFLTNLGVLLCRDTWPWEWGTWHRSTVLLQELALSFESPKAERGREIPLLRIWWSLCIPKAQNGAGSLLALVMLWLAWAGKLLHREWDSPCLNNNVSPGQFSVVSSFQCSGRTEKSCHSSHSTGHQSRQGIVKDSKKTLQLLCVPGCSPKI